MEAAFRPYLDMLYLWALCVAFVYLRPVWLR